ncbi:hypothetical protein [Ramlibacter tataouinensis]|uniref:Uncharacterized protein n=1 Tax=Ramlibacter tataouinensis (strain ATCC BAA-407 / DSM 14655 / LMG 21543 / TTB310) TaxID=365046 RepID=F5XVL4_RAMTT|nr:hypothetical protein [Ramlibacter tataouinensis]AEG91590.1 Hypothetical protein Rta_05140 [Ramlibacter tataouinensis TTB310]
MKLSPILIAAALAFGGSAIAQTRDSGSQAAGQRTTAGGVVDKGVQGAKRAGQATKRGAQRAASATGNVARRGADRMRSTGQALENRLPPAPQQAQRSGGGSGELGTMGAGPADGRTAGAGADDSRRQRMDDAYGSWRRQQGQR